MSTHLDFLNKNNYVYSSYFTKYNFPNGVMSLFSLLPTLSVEEKIKEIERTKNTKGSIGTAAVARLGDPPPLETVLLKIAISVGCIARHAIHLLKKQTPNNNTNNNNNNNNNEGDEEEEKGRPNVVGAEYQGVYGFVAAITLPASSYYYYSPALQNTHNFFPNELHYFKKTLRTGCL
jgi:hypothetical protein